MAIPKPVRPEYSTTIPSTGKKIKYQPFSVKEEKILILAAESQDQDEITNAIINVLQRCVTSPNEFKVEDLALFDIEYLFLRARSKSAGEKIKLMISDPDDATCNLEHEINIDKIRVEKTEGHTDLIEMTPELTVKMRYPDITFFNEGVNMTGVSESASTIGRCVSQIISGDEVYNRADISDEEMEEWMESLTTEQFGKLGEFFVTMPRLRHKVTLHNRKQERDFSVTLEGLSDFF